MQKCPVQLRLVVAAVAVLGCAAATANAQAKEEAIVLSPFVVSTRGDNPYKPNASTSSGLVNQLIIDSPFTMTAITAQALQDSQILDLADIRNVSAMLDQSAGGRGFGSEFNSRGFRTESLNNGHRTRQYMDNALIDVVELVNGPMATIYGESGAGGVVVINTKSAIPNKLFGSASVSVGDYNLTRGVVDVNVPLTRHSAVRVIGYKSDTLSYIDRWYDKKRGAYAAVHLEPLSWLTINGRADYMEYDRPNNTQNTIVRGTSSLYKDTDGDGFREFDFPNNYGAGPYYNAGPSNQLWRWKQGVMSGEAIATISPQLSARLSALYLNQDQDGINGWNSIDSFQSTPERVRVRADRERETKSFKLDLLYQWEIPDIKLKGKLIGGADHYQSSDRETYFEYQKPTAPLSVPWPPVNVSPSAYFLPSESTIISTWTLNSSRSRPYRDDSTITRSQRLTAIVDAFDERVRFTGGYRTNKGTFKQIKTNTYGDPYFYIPYDQPTYQYGVSGDIFKNTSDAKAFVSRLTAYYSYGTTFIPPRQGNPVGTPDVAPETGKGWDLGLKFEGLGGRLSGEVAYFDVTRDNVLVVFFPSGPSGPSYFINAGTQAGTGMQTSLNFEPTKGWTLGLQYMHISGSVVSDTNAANIGLPLTSPKNKITAHTRYEFRAGVLKGLSLGATVRYTADLPAHGYNNLQRDWILPANTVCGVFGRYEFKTSATQTIGLAVTVDNVFDRLYLDRTGDADFIAGAPRNIKVTLDYRF
jgi:outer membrane receptor protein involved in Fe transport